MKSYFLASRCHTEKQLFACIFLQIICPLQIVSLWLCIATSLTTVSWSWLSEFLVSYCMKFLMHYSFIFLLQPVKHSLSFDTCIYLVNCTTQYFPWLAQCSIKRYWKFCEISMDFISFLNTLFDTISILNVVVLWNPWILVTIGNNNIQKWTHLPLPHSVLAFLRCLSQW